MAEEWIAKDYIGGAVATVLDGAISSSTLLITVLDGSSWPTGANGKFVAVIGRATAAEERILVTSRAGTTLTVAERGYDGTPAIAHATSAPIEHGLDAFSVKQANAYSAAAAAIGSMSFRSAPFAYAEVPIGAAGSLLTVVGGIPVWSPQAPNILLLYKTASYTLVLSDANNLIEINSGSPVTLTVPAFASVAFPVGTVINGAQLGGGVITVTPAVGVTLRATPGPKTRTTNSGFTLINRAINDWYLFGDIVA